MAIEAAPICFFIDPPSQLLPKVDTSIRFMRATQANGYQVAYFTLDELFYEAGQVKAYLHFIVVQEDENNWFYQTKCEIHSLYEVRAVIIRKDPPFDQNYLYATYLLDLVAEQGILVSNSSQGIRDANEKIFATHFAELTPPTLITSHLKLLFDFLSQHQTIVIKTLNNRGGQEVILLEANNKSAKSILLMMSQNSTRIILVQKFIPEVMQGDKRILLINGTPLPFVLLRVPADGNFIANTFSGGRGYPQPLTAEDRLLCARLTEKLRDKGLDFVGIDVINGFLTEINVTSPTGIVPIMLETQLDIPKIWFQHIDDKLKNR